MNARSLSLATAVAFCLAVALSLPARLAAQEEGADIALAEALYDRGEFRQALDAYDIAMIRKLDDPFTLHRMSYALLQLDRYERARLVLERLIEVDPEEPTGHYNLGILYWRTGRPYLAIPCFETIVERDSSYGDAWACLGYLYLEIGEIETAWKTQTRLLAMQHEDAYKLQMAIVEQEDRRSDPTADW